MADNGWTRMPLGDFVTLQRGHDLPDQQRRQGKVPILGSFGITGWHDEAKASGRGVTVGRSGASFGVVSYSPVEFWPLNTALYVVDFHGNDELFAYYFLKCFDFQGYNSGSAQPSLNRNFVHPVPVDVPPLREQRAIAHILGTLDDKIELNRRMNETLESMARALFKSWFVDFDPVRAKAEGHDTGLPTSFASHFPNSFEKSELGNIPQGWRVVSLGDLSRRIAMGPFGSDIKTDNFIDFGVPVIRGSNLIDGFVENAFVFVSKCKADELRNANAFPGDIVITHRGTLGQVGMIPERSRFQRYVVSQSQMLLSVNRELATPRFVFEFLRSPAGQHALLANTSQTGVPAIARPTTSLRAIPLVSPPIEALRCFSQVVDPIFTRRDRAIEENRTLAALRDTLSPKLISGELRIEDPERFIGERA